MAEITDLNGFKLFDLPDKILPKVFQHLNDADLLTATRICKRIKAIAKEAFELKYNGEAKEKFYEVTALTRDETEEPKPFWPIFNTFGANIKAIRLNFCDLSNITKDHWIFRTMRQKCPFVERLEIDYALIDLESIFDFSKLTHLTLHNLKITSSEWIKNIYPSLISFHANHVRGLELEDINKFITDNPQLQELILYECYGFNDDVIASLRNNHNKLNLRVYDEFIPSVAKSIINNNKKIVLSKEKKHIYDEKQECESFYINMNDIPEAEEKLSKLKGSISILCVRSIASRDREPKKQFWNKIMTEYRETITKLVIHRVYFDDLTGYDFSLPNLEKLVLSQFKVEDTNVFKLFDFPKLTHLVMSHYILESMFSESDKPDQQLNIINHFKSLNSIKLDQLDKFSKQVFDGMNEEACARIRRISIGQHTDFANEESAMIMINAISQFRNLTELNIIHSHFAYVNFKHLFENCSKLIKLSLNVDFKCSNLEHYKKLFKCVGQNCKQIQEIQFIQKADYFTAEGALHIDINIEDLNINFLDGIIDLFPKTKISIVGVNHSSEVVKEKQVIRTSQSRCCIL